MKILLFGSYGLVGSSIKKECEERGMTLICPSHNELDVTNTKHIFDFIYNNKPDVVINSAAIVGKKACLNNKDLAYKVNAEAVRNLADICNKMDILLTQISSTSVFSNRIKYCFENTIRNPSSFYGRTKYLPEIYIQNNCPKHHIIRLPMIFGGNRFGKLDSLIKNLRDGNPTRIATDKVQTYGYTKDVAVKIVDLIESDDNYGTFHVGNKGASSLYTFMKEVRKYCENPGELIKAKCEDFGDTPGKSILCSLTTNDLPHWKRAVKAYMTQK